MRTFAVSLAVAGLAVLITVLGGRIRWVLGDRELVRALWATTAPAASPPLAAAGWSHLPPPVRRYLDLALGSSPAALRRGHLVQRGSFLMSPGRADGWRPFHADHHLNAAPAGFVWIARIRAAPGLAAVVRDSFVAGRGAMQASLLGLVPLADTRGTPAIAAAALHRYLAEAAWLPLALVPAAAPDAAEGGGVIWTPIDDRSARATLSAFGTTVSLDVGFGDDGLIASVYAPDRLRDVDGRGVPTPWQGRFWNYAERGGMKIPLAGEVSWILPEGPQPYWRGEVVEASYE